MGGPFRRPFGGPFGTPFGSRFGSPFGSPVEGPFGSLFGGARQAVKPSPPGPVTPGFLGPGGRLQRGVLSFRTSEFWRPVLGDLEAKNLHSLEDYSLVAKKPSPQQPGGPTRGPADIRMLEKANESYMM